MGRFLLQVLLLVHLMLADACAQGAAGPLEALPCPMHASEVLPHL